MGLYSSQVVPANIDQTPSGSSTTATVGVGTTAVQLLAANLLRKGFSIYNNSNRSLFLGTSNGVLTTTGFFTIVPANTLYEWEMQSIYTGAIFAIASGPNGSAQTFEIAP
jgi:hypothetical protein